MFKRHQPIRPKRTRQTSKPSSVRIKELTNAELHVSPDGHWLFVKTLDGKTAGCCLEDLGIGYGAEEIFVQWAEEQKKSRPG